VPGIQRLGHDLPSGPAVGADHQKLHWRAS
jgi:hypothetical protein